MDFVFIAFYFRHSLNFREFGGDFNKKTMKLQLFGNFHNCYVSQKSDPRWRTSDCTVCFDHIYSTHNTKKMLTQLHRVVKFVLLKMTRNDTFRFFQLITLQIFTRFFLHMVQN